MLGMSMADMGAPSQAGQAGQAAPSGQAPSNPPSANPPSANPLERLRGLFGK
jgi:hypothetical protein